MDITKMVEKMGPCSSSDLISLLMKKGPCSHDAARQKLSRELKKGRRLRYLGKVRMPSNGRVFYTEDQKAQCNWHDKLRGLFLKSGSNYGHVIHHLLRSDGAVEKNRLASLCGFPVKRRKNHILWSTALGNLLSDKIVFEGDGYENEKYIILGSQSASKAVTHAKYRTEQALIYIVKDYLRKNGFVAFDQVRCGVCNEDSEFGGYSWDLTAPTYISPYVSLQKGVKSKPGFWLVDCILGKKLSKIDISWFLEKIETLRSVRSYPPFTAILVANGFESDAFAKGRAAGAVLTTPATLFGENVAKALALLLEVFSNPGAVAVKDSEKVKELSIELAKIEGVMGNLRGDLFELLSGVALLANVGGNISLKVPVRSGTEIVTDIDVEIITTSAVYAVQCKGALAGKTINADEVRDWYRNKVGAIQLDRARVYEDKKQHHCFWTSGQFSPDALEFLNKHKDSCKKYDVEWKDGAVMKEYLREMGHRDLVSVLDRIAQKTRKTTEKSRVVTSD